LETHIDLLTDIITYIRRIIKSPSDAIITDNLIIDYINRFWIMDVDARIQLFDLKTQYQFQTIPGVDQYNMPLYTTYAEAGNPNIGMFPVYQGFLDPVYVNGIQIPLQTNKTSFYNIWPNIVQQMNVVAIGDGSTTTFQITFPIIPQNSIPQNPPYQYLLRGHVDMTGVIATQVNQDPPTGLNLNLVIPSTSIFPAIYLTSQDSEGNTIIVQDSGQFLSNQPNYGLLMKPGPAPFGYSELTNPVTPTVPYSITSNTVNYLNGVINVNFPVAPAAGAAINAQSFYFQCGLPRSVLFNNNTLTFRSPPDQSYLVQLDAYLSPAAFLTQSNAIPFGYMAEYIARGAARKILSDTGDVEQFQFYEPLFIEQERLVWKRSQRQFTANRTETIYSQGINQGQQGSNSLGGSTT
jgi:hypothetical protein